ncbi:MAG: D-alanyl-D-alanine carboxypeptidase family protein [Ramlibacter sp.]
MAAAVLALALAGGWGLWRALQPPGEQAPGDPAAPSVAVLPRPEAPASAPAAPQEEAAADEADGAPQGAYVPPLASDNTNLSYARRAGLHRAANPLRLTASAVAVLDARSGELLYGRNTQAILPIASLTKLLAGMVLLDAKVPLSQRIRITSDDVDTLRHSRSRLRVGTTLTRREALRLALMSSENRAAHALARTFPGGMEAFVAQMNRKAAELGMADAAFADPTGLSNANRATAQDVATMVVAASKYPLLRTFSTTERHQAVFGKRKLRYLNSNRLVRHTDWPILLQKTGYIVEAGQCMTMLTRVGGRDVVMVLLDAGSVTTRSEDARKLRRWVARQPRTR